MPADVRGELEATQTGIGLLQGTFLLPFATGNADPTGTTEGIPDGLTLLWIDTAVLKLSTFSRELGAWKTVTYA